MSEREGRLMLLIAVSVLLVMGSPDGRIDRLAQPGPGWSAEPDDGLRPDLYPAWLISKRCPSGSRKKQRVSRPQSYGGVRNVAPRARSAS
jgi:hypothetical protein